MHGAVETVPDTIELAAMDAARNIRRRYTIRLSVDLFGAFLVETSWGRIGAGGQTKCLSFESRTLADRYIAATLRRRATSTSRIGVAYQPLELARLP
jgi:predicted DNA-binding WGR domain protein